MIFLWLTRARLGLAIIFLGLASFGSGLASIFL